MPTAEDISDDPSIEGGEEALRRVHPTQVKPSTGEPDSSIFKNDPGGYGTSVTLWRSSHDLEIVTTGRDDMGVVSVTVQAFRDEHLGIAFTFEEGNPHHCEVFGPRTGGKQRRLRSQAKWVKYPHGYPDHLKGDLHQLYPAVVED